MYVGMVCSGILHAAAQSQEIDTIWLSSGGAVVGLQGRENRGESKDITLFFSYEG